MHLFLDSADPQTWALPAGCPPLAGVTTNPSLVLQARRPVSLAGYLDLLTEAQARGIAHLMLQLPEPDVAQGLAWATALVAARDRQAALANAAPVTLTFKLPCQAVWAPLLAALKAHGQTVLLTGLSNPMQLLWATHQAADYVAPYLGRLLNDGRDAWALMQACVAQQGGASLTGPKLLAASVKTADDFARLLALGAHAVTVKPEFAAALAVDSITQGAVAQFELDRQASLQF